MFRSKIFIPVAILFAITGCDKTEPLTGSESNTASLSLVNVNASARTVDFFLDGVKKNVVAPVAANGIITGTYIGVESGTARTVSAKDATSGVEYASASITGEANGAYTLFVYDTLVTGRFKTLLLNTNRRLYPDTIGTANVRFLNFSPRSPAVDAWFVRLVGAVRTDSVNLGNGAYIGSSTPNAAALSAYRNIRANQAAGANGTGSLATTYSIRVTPAGLPGTQLVAAATTIIPGRNYTFFVRGIYTGTAIPGISVVTDN